MATSIIMIKLFELNEFYRSIYGIILENNDKSLVN